MSADTPQAPLGLRLPQASLLQTHHSGLGLFSPTSSPCLHPFGIDPEERVQLWKQEREATPERTTFGTGERAGVSAGAEGHPRRGWGWLTISKGEKLKYVGTGGWWVVLVLGVCGNLSLIVSIFSVKEEAKRESGEEAVGCVRRGEEF